MKSKFIRDLLGLVEIVREKGKKAVMPKTIDLQFLGAITARKSALVASVFVMRTVVRTVYRGWPLFLTIELLLGLQ